MATGDFNAHCSRWWQNDISNCAGQEIDSLTLPAGHKQTIDNPTHVVNVMSCHTLTSYFVLTKIQFQIMQLMFHFLISVTITLFLARLTSMYHENISVDGEVKHINETLLNIFSKKN